MPGKQVVVALYSDQLPGEVEFAPHPGISGCILKLLPGEFIPGPVRCLRTFGNAKTQKYCRQAPQAMILDARLPGKIAQIDKSSRLEGRQLHELADVIVQTYPCLDNGRIGQDLAQLTRQTKMIQLKDINLVITGQLQKGRQVAFPLFIGGPRFRIKTEKGMVPEPGYCRGQVSPVADEVYRTGPVLNGTCIYLVAAHSPDKTGPVWGILSHFFAFREIFYGNVQPNIKHLA